MPMTEISFTFKRFVCYNQELRVIELAVSLAQCRFVCALQNWRMQAFFIWPNITRTFIIHFICKMQYKCVTNSFQFNVKQIYKEFNQKHVWKVWGVEHYLRNSKILDVPPRTIFFIFIVLQENLAE